MVDLPTSLICEAALVIPNSCVIELRRNIPLPAKLDEREFTCVDDFSNVSNEFQLLKAQHLIRRRQ